MEIKDLTAIIALRYKERMGIAPGKTKLIKLVYLAEIYFARLTQKRLTKQEWIYWKYGPYFWEFEEIILQDDVFNKSDESGDFCAIQVNEDYESMSLSIDESTAISRAMEHAEDDLNQILDFVYFDTEPMIKAQARGESLNFDFILPEAFYKIKEFKISKSEQGKIAQKIRNWEMNKKRAH